MASLLESRVAGLDRESREEREWLPLRLDLLDLPRLEATVGADGRFEIRHELDPAATANVPQQWLVQALIVDPQDRSRGVLSATAIGLRP